MLLVGLVLLGVFRSTLALGRGARVAAFASERLDAAKPRGAFVLGAAFGLAFCPTLFLLFFGLLIPLAIASPGGAAFPALFALGTALPVLAILGLVVVGLAPRASSAGPIARVEPLLTRLAGLVLVLAGLNDTVVYWLL